MRKFFKSLAVLLALTLIVGVIPAAAAEGLKMQGEKVLYLDGSKGAKEDGTQCKTGSKKLVANMIKGFDKDTMSVALSSADSSIVKANNKTGRIYAKSLGTTTVTVTVYDAAETQILKQDLKVKVKKNAADVTVTGIDDGDKVSVGQTVDVTLPRQGVDTDERALTVDNAEIAEVKAGEKARTYTVKFLKAGEATFTAKAYQSTKYPAATQTKTIKVTVTNPVPTKAEAIAANAIELTFDEDVEAFGLFKDAKEIPYDSIYYLANETTKVNINAVKAVKATANKVKIDLFGTLLDNQQYFVELNGAKLDFVLANIGPKDVATIEITTTRATKDNGSNATKIEYILRNKAGIDITASALEKGGTVSITQVDYNADIRGTGNKNEYEIVMWTAGAVANLKAKYSFFDSNDNYKEYTAEATGIITCVDESPLVFKKTVYTLNGSGTVASSETNLKHHFSLNEKNVYKLAVALVFTKDGKHQADLKLGSAYDGGTIKAWFPDNNTAMFTDGLYTINGNSEGTATAFIGYTKNGADKVIDVINIEVRGDKKASRIELKLDNDQKTLNVQNASTDKITFVANVFDQYNEAIDIPQGSTLVLNQIEASKSNGTLGAGNSGLTLSKDGTNTGKYKLTVDWNNFSGIGTNSVSLGFFVKNSYNGVDLSSNNVYFNAAQKNALAGNVAFTVNNSALDTSVFDKASKVTEDKAATLRIAKNDGGFFTGAVKGGVTVTQATSHTATQAAVGFQLEVLKNGSLIDIYNGDYPTFIDDNITSDGTIVVNGIVPVNTGEIKKLPSGTYTFRLFEYKMNDAGTFAVVQNPQVVTVAVSDKQVAPVYKQVSEVTASGTGSDCFTYTFEGKNIHDLSTVSRTVDYSDENTNASNVYVKSVKVRILVNLKSEKDAGISPLNDYWYDVKVTVGKSLKIKTNN